MRGQRAPGSVSVKVSSTNALRRERFSFFKGIDAAMAGGQGGRVIRGGRESRSTRRGQGSHYYCQDLSSDSGWMGSTERV